MGILKRGYIAKKECDWKNGKERKEEGGKRGKTL
jgi:hypothetical protein